MALYLVRATKLEQRNATGVNAYIVVAADAAAARVAAAAASPNGNAKPKASWEAVAITDQTIAVQGNVVVLSDGEKLRGN